MGDQDRLGVDAFTVGNSADFLRIPNQSPDRAMADNFREIERVVNNLPLPAKTQPALWFDYTSELDDVNWSIDINPLMQAKYGIDIPQGLWFISASIEGNPSTVLEDEQEVCAEYWRVSIVTSLASAFQSFDLFKGNETPTKTLDEVDFTDETVSYKYKSNISTIFQSYPIGGFVMVQAGNRVGLRVEGWCHAWVIEDADVNASIEKPVESIVRIFGVQILPRMQNPRSDPTDLTP